MVSNWLLFFSLLPWAAHMAKNWKCISEIGLRHPLCLCYIYLVVNPMDISTPDYSNKCFEIPQQETNSVNSCRWRIASTNIWKVDIKYVKKMKTTILCGHYVTFLELFYHMCSGKWQFRSTTSFSVLLRNHYHFVMHKLRLIYISTPLHQGTPVFELKAEIYSI